MISVEKALTIIDEQCQILPGTSVALAGSFGYVLRDDIIAHDDIPAFSNSAMDGYAVRAEDIFGACRDDPVRLKIIGEVPAGTPSGSTVEKGTAIRIMTGGMVPAGADTVVKIEDTGVPGDDTGSVDIAVSGDAGWNIRPAGEDIRRGEKALLCGNPVLPADMGILASLGVDRVPVTRKPKVAFLITGDEIIEPDEPLTAGKVRNSNKFSLLGMLEESGAVPQDLGTGADSPEALKEKLSHAGGADMIVTCGAVSVGAYDFLKEVLSDLGMKRLFWRVAQKPGKPLLFGDLNGVPVFGLPGNPASVMITFYVYVKRALRRMQGHRCCAPRTMTASLESPYSKKEGLTHYVRGVYREEESAVVVKPLTGQGSGVLSSMSEANCLIVLGEESSEIETGSEVTVILLR
jgi:molybdopterin molybdotransferase